MATIILNTGLLSPAANYPEQIRLDRVADMSGSEALDGEFRQYAEGRIRLITSGADIRVAQIQMEQVTRETREILKSWRGQTLLYRDSRGRLMFGSFLDLQVKERKGCQRLCDVNVTLTEISYPIELAAAAPAVIEPVAPPVPPAEDYSVMDYGADDTGAADSSAAFQAAFDAAQAAGVGVSVPAGTFLIDDQLYLRSGVMIHGAGDTTVIYSERSGWMFYGSGRTNIGMRDMKIAGPGTTEAMTTTSGIALDEITGGRFTNLTFDGLNFGFKVGSYPGATNMIVDNFVATNCVNPIFLGSVSYSSFTNLDLTANWYDSNLYHCIYMERNNHHLTFSNVTLHGGSGYCLQLYFDYAEGEGPGSDITFNNVVLDATDGRYPLVVWGYDDVVFNGITMINSADATFQCVRVRKCNRITLNDVTASGGTGLCGNYGGFEDTVADILFDTGTYNGPTLGGGTGITFTDILAIADSPALSGVADDVFWDGSASAMYTSVNRAGMAAAGQPLVPGYWFNHVYVSQGATITSALLKLTASGSLGTPTLVALRAFCEDADNPSYWDTDTHRPHDCVVTTAHADIAIAAWVTDTVYSFDIAAALQEIIDRPGWTPGNAVCVVLRDNGTPANNRIHIYDTGQDSAKAADLEVIFTNPS